MMYTSLDFERIEDSRVVCMCVRPHAVRYSDNSIENPQALDSRMETSLYRNFFGDYTIFKIEYFLFSSKKTVIYHRDMRMERGL